MASPSPHTSGAGGGVSGNASSSMSPGTGGFTAEMRDRQARGKDPYHSDSENSDHFPEPGGGGGSSSSNAANTSTNNNNNNNNNNGGASSSVTGPGYRVGSPKSQDSFATQERRRLASQILNSHELLMMAALRDSMSIPATRLKYMRMQCGIGEGQQQQSGGGGGGMIGRSGGGGAQQKRKANSP